MESCRTVVPDRPWALARCLSCRVLPRVLRRLPLAAVAAIHLWGCSPGYLLHLGKGELGILLGMERVEDLLRGGKLTLAEEAKVRLVLEAKDFGEKRLGLSVSRNYTTFYRVDGPSVAYNLTASPRLRLEARQWCFPIAGCMPYKGYFSLERAQREEAKLAAQDWDTYLRPVAAFSTLGWFIDPIFSTLLRYDDATLVEIVLHEMVHRTVFVEDQGAFNEGVATFIGEKGTEAFLAARSPVSGTPEIRERLERKWREERAFAARMAALAERLRNLYASDLESVSKLQTREEWFAAEKAALETSLGPERRQAYAGVLRQRWNNAFLISYLTYQQDFALWEQLYECLHGDLAALVARLKGLEGAKDPYASIRAWIGEDGSVAARSD